ncbi:tRNA threonylcarbamoyladenosine dehydratase [Verrucomicrobiaceae bacterium N1E253]|uniref:tRNA threonylcarbamoyladenosine dehydratase n=1 Tax=Oceaniferula marina TaxID=2748318 RepID=A0A851GHX8_9BACT|nr:tRNA threonylcarbamoyladenosine dehydratase [Oceaniferula marina]NWK54737.1 tRNA threonylcarbamoyladenosine dehydratase [Oceaniferula marina]
MNSQSSPRFGGIARLYGEPALEQFQQARVCVVGIGGVGSWSVESLARSGVGHITMIDLDEICITNINRQLHAMDGEIGRQKTAAMAKRVEAINPDCQIHCLETFFSERNADEILDSGFDFVIDAIDHVRAKCLLLAGCHQRQIPVVACGGAGGLTDPTQIKIDDLSRSYNDALLNQVRKNLRSNYGFPAGGDPQKKIKAKKFGIPCVFSPESPVFPQCDGSVSINRPSSGEKQGNRLNCASGFGSITHMTATVGLFATSQCLKTLATPKA